jgi:broad specificity phosphatase PhoE
VSSPRRGRRRALALGQRRRDDGIACVFSSDLRRAVETAEIAFDGTDTEIRRDPRLRECNYGELNGAPVELLEPRRRFVDEPYPGGESYPDCVERMLEGVPLEDLVDAPFEWQEGWEYLVPTSGRSARG